MDNKSAIIERLRLELSRLEIATKNIKRAIQDMENENAGQVQDTHTRQPVTALPPYSAKDMDGIDIIVVCHVTFLTEGKYSSADGIVTRFPRNLKRVFARNKFGHEVPRSPRNVRVIQDVE